ncbi:MAG: response regulator [Planctomycetota bacterium]
MKLAQLTPAHVRQAVAIYVDHAWPEGVEGAPLEKLNQLGSQSTLREMRGVFVECTSTEGDAGKRGCRRYTLRLGNRRYPWMKFVIQEYLVAGEFFFSVDTHDDLRVDPSTPDYEPWCELQRFNRDLKREIEADWAETDLPTHGDLRALCEGIARVGEGTNGADGGLAEELRGKRLLVVDDDEDVAYGAAAVLAARGYQVETAFDGRQVLDRMALDPLPDLVVLDFAMPEFDGEEVMRRLRADSRTASVPLLLATASDIDLSTIQRASGLLRKPYPRSVLYGMIDRLLRS